MFKFRPLIIAGMLACLAPAAAQADFVRYLENRGNDFLDMFRLRAGWPEHGRAIGAKVRVTSLAQAGFVTFDGTYAGIDRRGVGIVDERRREAGVSLLYGSFNEMEPTMGNQFLRANTNWSVIEDRRILRNLPHWDDGRRRPLSIGAELATPIGAIDVGVYPEEIFDFLIGFTTIDIFNDDLKHDVAIPRARATTEPVPDVKGPFANRRAAIDAWRASMESERLARLEQLEGTDVPAWEAPVKPSAATEPTGSGKTITPMDADSILHELMQEEARRAERQSRMAIERNQAQPETIPAPAVDSGETETVEAVEDDEERDSNR
jgi:hypothetical protein